MSPSCLVVTCASDPLSGRLRKRTGRASDPATISFIDSNVILVQNCANSPLEGNPRLDVGAFGGDLRRAGLCEVILILNYHEICGEPDGERLLFYADGLLLKPTRLDRRFVGGTRLPQRLLGIGDLQADLIL